MAIQFESEFILHKLTQKHLKDLFDLEFVASEIQISKLRMDNLAFDRKTNSFVIIEYKNVLNIDVLNQAQSYYDLVNNEKEEFTNRLDDDVNVDFKNTKVMIIGPEFSEKQIKEVRPNFELWKVSLYDNGKVTYKNLITEDIETLEIDIKSLKQNEDYLLSDKSPELCNLYHNLKNELINEFEDLDLRILVDAVSFRANDHIICIVNLGKIFKIYFHTQEIKDPQNKLRDISDIKTGALANYELKLSSKNEIPYFIELFKQVYEEKIQ